MTLYVGARGERFHVSGTKVRLTRPDGPISRMLQPDDLVRGVRLGLIRQGESNMSRPDYFQLPPPGKAYVYHSDLTTFLWGGGLKAYLPDGREAAYSPSDLIRDHKRGILTRTITEGTEFYGHTG